MQIPQAYAFHDHFATCLILKLNQKLLTWLRMELGSIV